METEEKMEQIREFSVVAPATGREITRYPLMDNNDVDQAVARARARFPEWAKTSFARRKEIFLEAVSIMAENARHYAELISLENGKTVMDAIVSDIYPALDLMKYYARRAEKILKPVRVPGTILIPGRRAYYVFEPRGVVGVISPWNYPFSLSAGPAISAIMAGNTVVLKPSSQTTRSGLVVQEVLEKAGLPKDVIHVVTGNGSITGRALIENQDLDMLFFTGSTGVGRKVNVAAAERLIPAIMELGGKDVAIVTKKADLGRAAYGTAWASFFNCGQTCIGTEVILVDRAVYEPFLEKLTRITQGLELGDKAGQIGSMTMESQLKIVEDQVEDAKKKGARIITGGERDSTKAGLFFPPTLIIDTTPDMKVRKEETFGPIKPVVPYDDIEEAIELANSSEYGLSGSVYTKDLDEGRWIAGRLKTGSVNINDALITYAVPSLPFGGMKHSGVGRYHGETGLRAFTEIKSITEFGWKLKREPYWYPIPEEGDKVAEDVLKAFFSRSPAKRIAAFVRIARAVWTIVKRMRKKKSKGSPIKGHLARSKR